MLSLFVANYLFVYFFIAGEPAHDSGIPVYRVEPISDRKNPKSMRELCVSAGHQKFQKLLQF